MHTDIGNRCVAAKVDRRLTPLRTVLRNGQTVEIITAKGASPNPSWVNFVVTAKARTAIRHYLKGLRRSEAIELGSKLLQQALGEFSLSLEDVRADVVRAALGELGMKDLDELYEKIGLGERLAPLVARRLLPTAPAITGGAQLAPLAIAGTEGLLVTYARCCFPIPYDPIFAFLSAGRGVVIHRENCVNVEDYRKHPGELAAGELADLARPAVLVRDPRRTWRTAPACWRRWRPPSPAPRPTSTTCRSTSRTPTPRC